MVFHQINKSRGCTVEVVLLKLVGIAWLIWSIGNNFWNKTLLYSKSWILSPPNFWVSSFILSKKTLLIVKRSVSKRNTSSSEDGNTPSLESLISKDFFIVVASSIDFAMSSVMKSSPSILRLFKNSLKGPPFKWPKNKVSILTPAAICSLTLPSLLKVANVRNNSILEFICWISSSKGTACPCVIVPSAISGKVLFKTVLNPEVPCILLS